MAARAGRSGNDHRHRPGLLSRVPGCANSGWLVCPSADRNARLAHCELVDNAARAVALRCVDHAGFDALLLPRSHAHGMREYPEATRVVAGFFDAGKPVRRFATVVLAARSIRCAADARCRTRRSTALTWARAILRSFALCRRWWDRDYHRTYREAAEAAGHRSVQAEVTRALARPDDFLDVPWMRPTGCGERPVPRFTARLASRRARWQLRVGTLARRRAHVCAHLRRGARRNVMPQGSRPDGGRLPVCTQSTISSMARPISCGVNTQWPSLLTNCCTNLSA